MADLRLVYPEVHLKWLSYLNSFNIDKAVLPLPESKTDKEQLFVYGKGINTAYYNVKNLKERLVKYKIMVPFDAVLIEALVTEGTLIRSGQKLGEYIDPEVYELRVAIAKEYTDLLQEGESVSLSNNKKTQNYTGTVSRINASKEQGTQTVSVFIEVRGSSLKEGMYLKADIEAKKVKNAIALDRSLVNDSDEMFVVKDTILSTIKVQPLYFSNKQVVVKGVPDGEAILAKQISGAYKGMLVKVVGDSLSKSEFNTSLVAVNQ